MQHVHYGAYVMFSCSRLLQVAQCLEHFITRVLVRTGFGFHSDQDHFIAHELLHVFTLGKNISRT